MFALAAIPANLVLSADVKLISVNPPFPTLYVVLVSVDEMIILPPSCVIVVAPAPAKVKSPGAGRTPSVPICVTVLVSVFVSVDAKLNTPADVYVIVTFEPPTKLIFPVL